MQKPYAILLCRWICSLRSVPAHFSAKVMFRFGCNWRWPFRLLVWGYSQHLGKAANIFRNQGCGIIVPNSIMLSFQTPNPLYYIWFTRHYLIASYARFLIYFFYLTYTITKVVELIFYTLIVYTLSLLDVRHIIWIWIWIWNSIFIYM